jgi:translation initiation factor 2 subunit 3
MLNVGSTQTGGRVEKVQDKIMRLSLAIPVCTSTGEKVAISRRIEDKWRLIGWGNVKTGNIINS